MTTAATDCWKTPERYVIIKRRNRAFNGKFLAVAVFPWTIRGITEERSWTTGIDVRLVNYKLWTLAWQARPCFQLTRYRTSGPYQVGSRQRENLLPPHRGQESVYGVLWNVNNTRETIPGHCGTQDLARSRTFGIPTCTGIYYRFRYSSSSSSSSLYKNGLTKRNWTQWIYRVESST